MNTVDTICAICTGTGGAISIIRISGTEALKIAEKIWRGSQTLSRNNARKMLYGISMGDPALAVYMPSPHSYTGEDVTEIHCHGGAIAARRILDAAIKAGARPAEPGEFTFRAFVNEKLDLTQAEAVGDIINAHSQMALNLAERQIAGNLSAKVTAYRHELIQLLAETESRLDFSEEDLDWQETEETANRISAVLDSCHQLVETFNAGMILRQGIRVVLAGRPNAGKSSLLNLLLGCDRAIVSQIPGTTRDTIEESTALRGIPVRLTDTAGIREGTDHLEKLGIDRSRNTLAGAQVIFWLLDASSPSPESEIAEMKTTCPNFDRVIAVWNKTDLMDNRVPPTLEIPTVAVSVLQNHGIENLLDAFEKMVWGKTHAEEPEIAINSRHLALLNEVTAALPEAINYCRHEHWELAAVGLRQAISSLGNITGETVDPDILDNIFSQFCIGK